MTTNQVRAIVERRRAERTAEEIKRACAEIRAELEENRLLMTREEKAILVAALQRAAGDLRKLKGKGQ